MRTLSPQEIIRIDQRLESLKIYYLEIHHEIRDHYFTELEKKPAAEFEAAFQQLNEAFAWSVVRRMEKELLKAKNQQIGALQWKVLKFLNLNSTEILLAVLVLVGLIGSYLGFGFSGIFTGSGIIAIFGAGIIWRVLGWKNSLNFSLTRHKPIDGFSAAILTRISLVYGFFSFFTTGFSLNGSYSPNPFFSFLISCLVLVMTLYVLTLIKATFDHKKKTA